MRHEPINASIRPKTSRAPIGGALIAGSLTHLINAISAIVYPWLVYDLTGSAAMMGAMAAAVLLPAAVGALFGGVIIDRFGVRQVAVAAGATNLTTALLIATLTAMDQLTFEMLLVLAAIGSILDGPGVVAFEARLPEMSRIARTPLMRVNVIDDFLDNGAAILGPGVGALLIGTVSTTGALIAVAGLSALALAVTLSTLPGFSPRRFNGFETAPGSMAGLNYLFREPTIRTMLFLGIVGMAIFIAADGVILPAILRAEGRPALDLAAFVTASAGGAIVANLALLFVARTPSLRIVYTGAFVGLTGAMALLLFDRSTVALLASGFLLGISAGPVPPIFATQLQKRAPKTIRASVLGASTALLLTGAPVVSLVAGISLDLFGPTTTLAGCVALLASSVGFALGLPQMIQESQK